VEQLGLLRRSRAAEASGTCLQIPMCAPSSWAMLRVQGG
jgi:hypothetical protein